MSAAHVAVILHGLNEQGLQQLLLLKPVRRDRMEGFGVDGSILHGELQPEKAWIGNGGFEIRSGDLFE
jgi:hypothetical protein